MWVSERCEISVPNHNQQTAYPIDIRIRIATLFHKSHLAATRIEGMYQGRKMITKL